MGERSARAASLVVVAMLAAWSAGATPAAAGEETDAHSAAVVGQLEGIRGELRSIAQLLGSLEKHQRVTALMARMRPKQERLAAIEGRLLSARGEREDVKRELEQLTGIEQAWMAETDGDLSRGDAPSEHERRQVEMLRQQKKILASRVDTLDLRIVELENDLSRARDDILALEQTVDEQLGLR